MRKMRSRSSVVGLLCLAAAVVWGTAVPSTAGGDSRQPTVRFDVLSVVDGAAVGGGTAVSTAVGPAGFVGDTLTITATGTAEPR